MVSPTNGNAYLAMTQFFSERSPEMLQVMNKVLPKHSVQEIKVNGNEFEIHLDKKEEGKVSGQESLGYVKGAKLAYSSTIRGKIDESGKIYFQQGDVKGKKGIMKASLMSVQVVDKKDGKGQDVKAEVRKMGARLASRVDLDAVLFSLNVEWKK